MSTPTERVQQDLRQALKAGHKTELSTLRLLLAAIKNEQISSGREVDEATFLTLVQRASKQRREAADQYRQGNRPELADKEEAEAEILSRYLPEPVSEDDVRQAIAELIAAEGLEGPKALGRVMGTLAPRFKGRIDGRELQRLAREILG